MTNPHIRARSYKEPEVADGLLAKISLFTQLLLSLLLQFKKKHLLLIRILGRHLDFRQCRIHMIGFNLARPSGSTSDAPADSSPPAHDPKTHPPTPPTPSTQEAVVLHSPSSHTPAATHPSQHLSAPHVPTVPKIAENSHGITHHCSSPLSSPPFP